MRRTLIALLYSLLATGMAAAAEKVPFRNWQQMRLANVVMQKLDFSCGAASLATLSTFFLGKPVTEEALLRIVRARYTDDDWKKKKQEGLSMEDLAFMAERIGLKAEGGLIGLSGLLKLNGPVIVHLDKKEFQHFTVLRGIHGMTVYLSDPSLGTVPMSLGSFVEQFTGAVLAVWDPGKPVPESYPIKLKDQDKFYARLPDMVRPSLYERPQIMLKNF
jgi:predicted double-glycine peptidase